MSLQRGAAHSPPFPANVHLLEECKYINAHNFIVRLMELRESPLCYLACFRTIINIKQQQ